MAKKSDPAVAGFQPIEVEPYVDKTFVPIEVVPHDAEAPAPVEPQSPDAGENKEK